MFAYYIFIIYYSFIALTLNRNDGFDISVAVQVVDDIFIHFKRVKPIY